MTCVVGFVDKINDSVWIGADSLGSNGWTKSINLAPKVFRNDVFKDVIMGSTSTFRHIDLLKYTDNLLPEIDKYKGTPLDHKYMVKTFIPNIISLFQNYVYSEDPKDKGANFLIGAGNQLFEIQTDYSVLVPETGFAAVGSGEAVAMGSLLTTTKLYSKASGNTMAPIDHILCALRAATEYCCGVQGPYIIMNTKEEKVYTFKK